MIRRARNFLLCVVCLRWFAVASGLRYSHLTGALCCSGVFVKDSEFYDLWSIIQTLSEIIDTAPKGINEFTSENRQVLYELRNYFERHSEINAKT